MAFTKRQNRRIVVGGEPYLWYLKGNWAWDGDTHIAIRHNASLQGQLLLLDYNARQFEIRPQMIREAIEFALAQGWNPRAKALPLYVGHNNREFVVLPPGVQYLSMDSYHH